ncbi:SCO-spondin-like [Trichechus inunguis]
MLLLALLFMVAWAVAGGRWCEQTETVWVEELVTPRQEDLVPCASLYHHLQLGWHLGPSQRAHNRLTSDPRLCPIYRPPETRPAARTRTVRACCPGWGGAHCSLAITALGGASPSGHCFATGQCRLWAGVVHAPAGSLEECCARVWGHSWRDGSSQACIHCSGQSPQGGTRTLAPLQPRAGAVGQLWSQRQHPSATCATWSGFHYRTFDGRHFHFLGRCTYLLAGAADSSWAVHLLPGGHCPQPGHCQLVRVTMGPEEALIQGGNVSVNGVPVPKEEPQMLHGMSLQWQGDWLVLSGDLGVIVWLDGAGSVSISLDPGLQGQTRGLCGLYNDQPEDDFLEPSGGLAVLAATFGNSWRLPDSEPGCVDATEAAPVCTGPLGGMEEASQLRAEAQDVCHLLLSGPFRECHVQVAPTGYHEACLFAYCAGAPDSKQAGRREAVCATLASYTRHCAREGIHVHWRKPGFCERLCPGGQLYSDCVSSCPPSCSAVGEGGQGSCQEQCVSGCECPPGLYWDGTFCVPPAQCPCYHRRQRYAPGDTVHQLCNPCVCQDGRWHCAEAPCPAQCAVGADGHYLTFDGRSFSFRGNRGCRYSLVQDHVKGQLLIELEHGACESGSCLHAILASLGGTHVQLKDSGAVLVDGQEVAVPWHGAGDLSVSRASSSFLLLRWPGARVLWGVSDPSAYITLEPRYAYQVQGLCGTFTWNQQDDFLTPVGDVETSVASFTSKFQVAGVGKCPPGDAALSHPCSTHTQRRPFAEAACTALHDPAFQKCHGLVDRESYWLRCLAAVCGCTLGEDCLCPLLAAYARHCAQEGALQSWRSQTLCPVTCPGGQEHQECAPACGRNCGEPEDCVGLGVCVSGCNCPPGLLWDPAGQCVPPSLCPCQLGAQRHASGSTTMKDCNRCVCQERGIWNCTAHRCSPRQVFCPRGLIHVPGACLLTCDSSSANHTCPMGNTKGCVCPPGTVLLDERCVPTEHCPCRHSGRWYPPNATIQEDCNVCVCQGQRWHCTRHQCGGHCQASGAPHYVTFDGLAMTFPGACEYLLVRAVDGQFSVSAQNLPCGASGLTCTKALSLQLEGTIVHLLRGRAVTVNGVPISPPKVYTGLGLSLHRAGLFLVLSTRVGLSLLWDGGTRVLVHLPPQFRGRVAGLCGDFDGDASNDLRSRQGVLEPMAELAAHSWRLRPLCPEPGDMPHPCTVNAHRAEWARARCGVLLHSLFAACHAEVPPQTHYEQCVYDACGCDSGGDCECLCSAIATYADECARRGHRLRWRSQELCPLQCEGGQLYDACGPTCPPTCRDQAPEPGWHCQVAACVEGCFCPEGTLLHGSTCLEPASCPCEWGGSFFPPGAVLQKDCGNCTCQDSRWYCGAGGPHCEEPVPSCAEGEVPCRENGHCVPRGWLCDNQDDCGDGSDEEGCATPGCGEGQFSCSSGRCLPMALRCDGQDDCADGADEQGCPCPQESLACADGHCLPLTLLCDGHPDCPDGADEKSCLGRTNCTSGEVSCGDDSCVGAFQLCDGVWDCPDGADEGPRHCPLPSLPTPPAGSLETTPTPPSSVGPGECSAEAGARGLGARRPREHPGGKCLGAAPSCGPAEFACGSGECVPRGWRCDRDEDCADGSDERDCGAHPAQPCLARRKLPLPQVQTSSPPHLPAQAPRMRRPGSSADRRRQLLPGPRGPHPTHRADPAPSTEPSPSADPAPSTEPSPSADPAPRRPLSPAQTPPCGDPAPSIDLGPGADPPLAVLAVSFFPRPLGALGPTQLPPCPGLFPCGLAPELCLPADRLCDGTQDCPQAEDELGCEGLPALGGPNRTGVPCPEYSCPDGACIGFQLVCDGRPDCELAGDTGLSPEEQGCGTWGPWSPWAPCSQTCGPGVQVRSRRCSPARPLVLQYCPGPEHQSQACFSAACPVDGEWSPWSSWSPCLEPCGGTTARQRRCRPAQNGGRSCATLPGGPHSTHQTKPCTQDGCPNATCPGELVLWPCAPCPLTCEDISSQASCPPDRPCNPGCWCPEGQLLGSAGRCVWPRHCPCLVDGARYWPGQRIEANCQVCVCQDGWPRRCRPNPDCTVDCGWSSWSPWAECLGPCGSHSIQWSFRSPNNPHLSERSSQCRGIHRKARRALDVGERCSGKPAHQARTLPRCQTEPCAECEWQGRAFRAGQRWRGGPCEVCQCLYNRTVHCSPYCPLGGCPQGWFLVEGVGAACCHCILPGENQTAHPMATPAPAPAPSPQMGPPLATYLLPPPGGPCYSPLGLAGPPQGILHAISRELEHPAWAASLGAPTEGSPGEAHPEPHTPRPLLQLDLRWPWNLTGILVQGAGAMDGDGSSFSLQFSSDGLQWHEDREVLRGPLLPPQVSPAEALFSPGHHTPVSPQSRPLSDAGSGWAMSARRGGSPEGTCSPGVCTLTGQTASQSNLSQAWTLLRPLRGLAGPEPRNFQRPGRLVPGGKSSRAWQGRARSGAWASAGSWDGLSPAMRIFGRMVQARYVRIQPRGPHDGVSLRVELLGCKPTSSPMAPRCPGAVPSCASGECAWRGAACDGAEDCADGSDEEGCGPRSTGAGRVPPTGRTPGPSSSQPRQLVTQPRESLAETELWHPERGSLEPPTEKGPKGPLPASKSPHPSSGESMPSMAATPTSQPEARILQPDMAAVTGQSPNEMATPAPAGPSVRPGPFPPTHCGPGQVRCAVLGCVEPEQLCDGLEDCLDGSDEWRCASTVPLLVPTMALPQLLATCSPQQLRCGSGECLPALRRCDLRPDCQDGSDERDCVDCVLAPWSGWSGCSQSCGPGLAVQHRQLLRPPLPGGSCRLNRVRSRSCFLRACPVAGAWAVWEAWGPCSVSCGGGHRTRRRSCKNPPPKNSGAPCPGASQEGAPCSLQPCGGGTDCGLGRVHVSAELCRKGLVPLCPPSCLDPEANRSCSGHCLEGCRCPSGLLLHDRSCLPLSQCPCLVGEELKPPGEPFLLDSCSWCICEEGALRCESRSCPVPCGWSAWSPWGPCDRSCGSGVRARFRSPSNPPAAAGGVPCEGDRQELQACHAACGTEVLGWTPWMPWSRCNRSCLTPGEGPGWRRRSRLCSSPGHASCTGEDTQEEACSPPMCPVPSAWGPWAPWSACLVPCDGGIQTRGRSCSGPAPGDPECRGPHSQTRDCNTQPCTAQCPGDMVFRSEEQCRQEGGPCPRLCVAHSPGVECTGSCVPGCTCPSGLFLHDARCLPRDQCPCQWHGRLYPPGEVARLDSCNNCTCVSGKMECTSQPCPVACGWSPWTPWTICSRSCNVGIRRRFRAGTAPPAAFGGAECQGPNMEAEFCSLRLCQGLRGKWGPWSPCSVPCGGGYRNRTRGSGPHSPVDFSTCSLQPCAGPVPGMCPGNQQWLDCALGPASCAELSAPGAANGTCRPGCYCPPGTLLLNNACVPTRDCPCTHEGRLHAPGSVVLRHCENCSCVSGIITNCTSRPCAEAPPAWSPWTPWSECSASCGPAWRHRHRFCPGDRGAALSPALSSPVPPCLGPEAEEEPCLLSGCDRAGGWGPWGPWSRCSRSCGGGLRSRARVCDQPPPQGLGDYCEGPGAQAEACRALRCPVTNCTAVEGAEYSPCGPPCPRTCDDLALCVWRCQPGCYCPLGQVLSADGATCVQPGHCGCLDLLTGERYHPGARLARPDSCNHCTCLEGKLNCTDLPCPVPGGWCPWSEWTPCSLPCRGQQRTRSRACACPSPQHGGTPCPGETGAQQQKEACPSPEPCPEDGAWSLWGPWSPCDMCLGQSYRSRVCTKPPNPEGGRPCPGAYRQSRPCQDSSLQCTDCRGGQGLVPCGRPCPRSCQDLSLGSECQPGPTGCQPSCGCPLGQLVQDGLCVPPAFCRCQYQPGAMGIPENQSRSAGPGLSSWESLEPGEVVTGPCDTCTCVAGVLQCQEVPSCPGPGAWDAWGPWEACSASCGGGEQLRVRHCARPPCPGPARQSRTCHTQVCKEAGCSAGRLYRECRPGEGCPFSCAHVTQQLGCYSEGCEEGCHCPQGAFQHRLACVQECPCVLTARLLQELGAPSLDPGARPLVLGEGGRPLGPGDELGSGQTFHSGCSNCSCAHGKLSCSREDCAAAGGFGPWSAWSPCSRSCGGLGTRSRSRLCVRPAPSRSGQACLGPRQDREPCPSRDCPSAWGPWSPWSLCSRNCTDPARPAWRHRDRLCLANCSSAGATQERPCNLPSCTEPLLCPGPGCVARNCSWTAWAPWEPCSRSCGAGQQRRLRAYRPPGPGGHWCPNILSAYQERRFCNVRACPVSGGWSRWSPWSWCDRSCGGGRSLRSRSCSSPPPKNGGAPCVGERHHARPCNSMPCEGDCPAGMEVVSCANRCPRRCSDLQEGAVCRDDETCQRGCRCPEGSLEQGGGCVPIGHCECTDAQGRIWAPGSRRQEACSDCTCQGGRLSCTARSCPPPTYCAWSQWSAWSPCSRSCGPGGQQSRFRSSTSGSWSPKCREEQSQSQTCLQPPCPPLCVQGTHIRTLGDSWLQGACEQCSCTPEGVMCEDTSCAGPEAWTPWSSWSSCPVSCGGGSQVRTRVCTTLASLPRGQPCSGPDSQTQPCGQQPCPELPKACSWGPWGLCSRSCGPGLASRSGSCPCPMSEPDSTCNVTFLHLDTRACYPQPCPEACVWSSWSSWTRCSCRVPIQQRSRHQVPAPGGGEGTPCTRLDGHFRPCPPSNCSEDSCAPPFEFRACGSPCAGLCATHLQGQLCQDLPPCQPGCYCPEGLLEQAGACVPPERCHCLRIPGGAAGMALPPGGRLWLGCKEWARTLRPSVSPTMAAPTALLVSHSECQHGELRCISEGCRGNKGLGTHGPEGQTHPVPLTHLLESRLYCGGSLHIPHTWPFLGLLPLSSWSEWTPCGPCLPLSALAPASRIALWGRWPQDLGRLPPTSATLLASEQHRYRLCLDPETGQLWAGDPQLCTASLSQQRLCPDPRACQDLCQWGPWGPWSPCQLPCSGGFRLRWREAGGTPGGGCRGPWAQTEGCNLAPCPGASCAARGAEFSPGCANQCPRSCADLWDRVQCLQGPCRPGCRCPPSQLVQDGHCVPISSCRCGLPSHNSSWELSPAEVLQLGCQNCTCVNGSLACLPRECPVLGPWSAWSNCSLPCGGGTMERHRSCKGGPWGALCLVQDTEQRRECNLWPCPECPQGEVWQTVALRELRPCEPTCREVNATEAPQSDCSMGRAGCVCQHGRFRSQAGLCVPADGCECWHRGRPHPPGSEWQEACESCRCLAGRSVCTQHCPLLTCAQGEVKVQEPGSCCPTCRQPTLEGPIASCQRVMELRNLTKGPCHLDQVEVSYCSGHCPSSTNVILEEPYLQSRCQCCSYRLDPDSPVRVLSLRCPGGRAEPAVLPAILSCHCSACPALLPSLAPQEVISQSADSTVVAVPVGTYIPVHGPEQPRTRLPGPMSWR